MMLCAFVMQEWFPLRQQLLSLSSGWLMFVAGVLAVVYLWVKVRCAHDYGFCLHLTSLLYFILANSNVNNAFVSISGLISKMGLNMSIEILTSVHSLSSHTYTKYS